MQYISNFVKVYKNRRVCKKQNISPFDSNYRDTWKLLKEILKRDKKKKKKIVITNNDKSDRTGIRALVVTRRRPYLLTSGFFFFFNDSTEFRFHNTIMLSIIFTWHRVFSKPSSTVDPKTSGGRTRDDNSFFVHNRTETTPFARHTVAKCSRARFLFYA